MSTPMETQSTTAQEGTTAALAEEARAVASTATSATQDVAHTAMEQAGQVAGEAAARAKDLVGQAKDEVGVQVEEQTTRLAGTLRSTAQELESMASSAAPGSTAQQLVQGIAGKGIQLADAIEQQGPGGLVQSLQDLGRRRPGMFLLGAMAAGVAVGRLGRAAKSASGAPAGAPTPSAVRSRPLPGPGTTMSSGVTMGTGLDPATGDDPMHTVVLPETGHRTQ